MAIEAFLHQLEAVSDPCRGCRVFADFSYILLILM